MIPNEIFEIIGILGIQKSPRIPLTQKIPYKIHRSSGIVGIQMIISIPKITKKLLKVWNQLNSQDSNEFA